MWILIWTKTRCLWHHAIKLVWWFLLRVTVAPLVMTTTVWLQITGLIADSLLRTLLILGEIKNIDSKPLPLCFFVLFVWLIFFSLFLTISVQSDCYSYCVSFQRIKDNTWKKKQKQQTMSDRRSPEYWRYLWTGMAEYFLFSEPVWGLETTSPLPSIASRSVSAVSLHEKLYTYQYKQCSKYWHKWGDTAHGYICSLLVPFQHAALILVAEFPRLILSECLWRTRIWRMYSTLSTDTSISLQ